MTKINQTLTIDKNKSYATLYDGTIINFELVNTPIDNFTTYTNKLILNDIVYNKPDIKSIVFGESYMYITSIGNNFLSNCSGLTSIDLSGLSQITSIGNNFLYNCLGLTSIDLSGLSILTSIGDYFLYGCSGLPLLDICSDTQRYRLMDQSTKPKFTI